MIDAPSTATAAPGSAPALQGHLVFSLPVGVEARELRVALLTEGVIPKSLWDQVAFFGHRGALNLVAMTPDANRIMEIGPDIGLWLAERHGCHVPVRMDMQAIGFAPLGRPVETVWGPVVLAKSGRDWEKANDPGWVMEKLASRLSVDLSAAAAAWGLTLNANPTIVSAGKLMPIKAAVATSPVPATFLCAVDVKVSLGVGLEGQWSIGAMRGAGFGRLYSDIKTLPSALRRLAAGKHVPETLAEQLEALL